MRIRALATIVFSTVLLAGAFKDDVLQLKSRENGRPILLVGKAIKITETTVEFEDKTRGRMTISVKDVEPYSLYRVMAERIDPEKGADHFALAEWCLKNELPSTALRELEDAKKLDPKLTEKCDKLIRSAQEDDARRKLESAKELIVRKEYEKAARLLGQIIRLYPETPYAKKAGEETEKLTDLIVKENQRKAREKEEEEDRKKQDKEDRIRAAGKRLFVKIREDLDQVEKLWKEGLEKEAIDNTTLTRRPWEAADRLLDNARAQARGAQNAEEEEVVREANDLLTEIDIWHGRICWHLARSHAEHLSFQEGIAWINKALALPHDRATDDRLNDLLLNLTQLRMRMRAAGKGF